MGAFSARYPALGVDSLPGIGSQVPSSRDAVGNKAEFLPHASKNTPMGLALPACLLITHHGRSA